jgi:hypothetical protein
MTQMIFPTKEEFLNVFNIFPRGNPESIFLEVKYTITSAKTFSGQPVTWALIEKSYTDYINKRRSEDVQDKFIKSLDNFLKAKDYNIDFGNEPSMKQRNVFEAGLDDSLSELERRLNGKGK